jgi:hypothetical protein
MPDSAVSSKYLTTISQTWDYQPGSKVDGFRILPPCRFCHHEEEKQNTKGIKEAFADQAWIN